MGTTSEVWTCQWWYRHQHVRGKKQSGLLVAHYSIWLLIYNNILRIPMESFDLIKSIPNAQGRFSEIIITRIPAFISFIIIFTICLIKRVHTSFLQHNLGVLRVFSYSASTVEFLLCISLFLILFGVSIVSLTIMLTGLCRCGLIRKSKKYGEKNLMIIYIINFTKKT